MERQNRSHERWIVCVGFSAIWFLTVRRTDSPRFRHNVWSPIYMHERFAWEYSKDAGSGSSTFEWWRLAILPMTLFCRYKILRLLHTSPITSICSMFCPCKVTSSRVDSRPSLCSALCMTTQQSPCSAKSWSRAEAFFDKVLNTHSMKDVVFRQWWLLFSLYWPRNTDNRLPFSGAPRWCDPLQPVNEQLTLSCLKSVRFEPITVRESFDTKIRSKDIKLESRCSWGQLLLWRE